MEMDEYRDEKGSHRKRRKKIVLIMELSKDSI